MLHTLTDAKPPTGFDFVEIKAEDTSEHRMHDVVSGDTLSGIAKEHLGNANAYTKIFEANRDQLSDPDKIKPGQVLKIPA